MEQLHTLADVESLTKRRVGTLRSDIRRGDLAVVRLGRQVRVTEKSLRSFIAGKRSAKSA